MFRGSREELFYSNIGGIAATDDAVGKIRVVDGLAAVHGAADKGQRQAVGAGQHHAVIELAAHKGGIDGQNVLGAACPPAPKAPGLFTRLPNAPAFTVTKAALRRPFLAYTT